MKKITAALPIFTLWICTCILHAQNSRCPGDRTIRMIHSGNLPAETAESSGLAFAAGLLWTLNDSGNEPVIFGLDTNTGKVVKRVFIRNCENIDWEELSAGNGFLFIGDFGNNSGTRHDLRVLRIPENLLMTSDTLVAEVIHFAYREQSRFRPEFLNTPFDCEAMVCNGDSLYLFTKDWTSGETSMYVLPSEPGTYTPGCRAKLPVPGTITGASLCNTGDKLILLGYRKKLLSLKPFVCIYQNFNGMWLISGKTYCRKLSKNICQTEAIVFINPGCCLISSEMISLKILRRKAALYKIHVGK